MVEYLPRSAWTSVPKPSGLADLNPATVVGDAQHWPGIDPDVSPNYKFAGRTQKQIATYLEGIRRYHTGTNGWTDIAYLQAIDPAGRVWDCRGLEHRSAANGDTIPNARYGATLWLVGPNERPTDAQVTAYQTFRTDRWLRRYPDAVQVKRHSDVRPEGTACPGPYVGALVTSGTLTRPPEDDMATAEDIAEQILRREKVGDDVTVATALGQMLTKQTRTEATLKRIEDKVDADEPVILSAAQMDALAADLKAQITPAVVVAVTDALQGGLAKEVLDGLAARLKA